MARLFDVNIPDIMATAEKIDRIYHNAHQVFLQMYVDRGYVFYIDDDTRTTIDYYKNHPNLQIRAKTMSGDNINTVILDKTSDLSYTEYLEPTAPVGKTIILYNEDHGSNRKQAEKLLASYDSNMSNRSNMIEAHSVQQLSIDPINHAYQPKGIRLITDQAEINRIYIAFNAKGSNFPQICLDDPVNTYYGGKIGDIYYIPSFGYRRVTPMLMNYRKTK